MVQMTMIQLISTPQKTTGSSSHVHFIIIEVASGGKAVFSVFAIPVASGLFA